VVLRQARPGVTAIFFEFARLFIQLSREDRNHCVGIALIICAWFASGEPDRGAIDVGAGPQEADGSRSVGGEVGGHSGGVVSSGPERAAAACEGVGVARSSRS
jgi:hypothetical protein